jgi:hypothetical protein
MLKTVLHPARAVAAAVLIAAALSAAALIAAAPARAQAALPLIVEETAVIERADVYGQTVQVVTGVLRSTADDAYTRVTLEAAGFSAADAVIAEGFGGVLVDACGGGLVFDFALQPGAVQPFEIPLEVFEPERIARVEVTVRGDAVAPLPVLVLDPALTQAASGSAVEVEWRGPRSLRYAEGCARSLFTAWAWQSYNLLTGASQPVEHPRAAAVNDALFAALRLDDPLDVANAAFHFDPYGERMVFQDGVNRFFTAAADGRFVRLVHSGMNSYTLQGVYWLGEGRFLATYYGTYGDPVLYFTADAEARAISPGPLRNYESAINPGASRDGRRVVLAGDFEDGPGYYIRVVSNGFFEQLFAGAFPGNNYPSPLPFLSEEGDRVAQVLVARDVAAGAWSLSEPLPGETDDTPIAVMQCFNRDEGVLYDLARLPLRLLPGARAQWWLSPDERTIALVADGPDGGLWLIDRAALPACAGAAQPETPPDAAQTGAGG